MGEGVDVGCLSAAGAGPIKIRATTKTLAEILRSLMMHLSFPKY
jgi:hypothetical protein